MAEGTIRDTTGVRVTCQVSRESLPVRCTASHQLFTPAARILYGFY
jgi:hypothetical protein